jgi:hypothetical protein
MFITPSCADQHISEPFAAIRAAQRRTLRSTASHPAQESARASHHPGCEERLESPHGSIREECVLAATIEPGVLSVKNWG